MKHKDSSSLESCEFLIATNKVSGDVKTFQLTKYPFRIGFMAGNYTYGNDYGVDARVGGRVPGEGSKKGYMFPMLSREHCGISLEDGARYLYDLGSRTGTFLNGKRIGREKLNNGDKIDLIPVDDEFLLEIKYVVK